MANSALERNPYFNGRGGQYAPQQWPNGQTPSQPTNAYPGAPADRVHLGKPGQPSAEQLDAQFGMPPATPDQMDRMSVEDTVAKTAGLFLAVLVAAGIAWFAPWLAFVGAIGAIVLSLVLAFQREPKPVLIWLFAGAEGLLVGGLTRILEGMYSGIAMQAVLATLCVVGVTLALFSFGKVRSSPRMTKIVMIAMIGYAVFSLANFVGMMVSPDSGMFGWRSSVEIFGIPLGVILGVFAVLMGAYMLVMDFEFIQNGVRSGAPRRYGWIGAYALVSTVTFIYVEILRLIAIFRSN